MSVYHHVWQPEADLTVNVYIVAGLQVTWLAVAWAHLSQVGLLAYYLR